MPTCSAPGKWVVGRGPGTGASLQSELAAARKAAESGLQFFLHVAPLAQRLGMTDFPQFPAFESRFCQSDDLSTARLRADGVVVQQLHTTVASAVDVQKQHEGALAEAWPDGSGIVAQQQLRTIFPRAEADLAEISAIGAGMLIAADCIDVARFTQYGCIATIDPDSLLGVPIALWLKMKTACLTHHSELRAAITAAVDLFGTAVTTCDEAIDAILSGLCAAMAAVGSTDNPAATGAPPAATDEPASREGDSDLPGGAGVQAAGVAQSPDGGAQAECRSGGTVGPAPGSTEGPTVAAGLSPAVVTSPAMITTPAGATSAFSGEAASELLGPLLGAVGSLAAAAMTGLAEAITTVVAQGGLSAGGSMDEGPQDGSAGTTGRSAPAPGPASIMLGDKLIEIEAGPDGASVSLAVTGAGGDTDTHVLEIRPDGSIGSPEAETGPGHAEGEGSPAAEPVPGGQDTVPEQVVPAPSSAPDAVTMPPAVEQTPCPPADSGGTPPLPQTSPQTAAGPVPGPERTTPGAGGTSPKVATPVSPQSSQQNDAGTPADDGQLALAGDQ